jgi:16S rRNA (adenine1518-N6/adenine1519-N6)-dimethyltransferase
MNARELLARHGLHAKKSWGQNFLIDPTVQERIVAAARLTGDDVVVEIGAGLGALTVPLAKAARKVIAVERDPDLVRLLRERLPASLPAAKDDDRVEVVAADALELDFTAWATRDAGARGGAPEAKDPDAGGLSSSTAGERDASRGAASRVARPLVVVGNLPYQITSPLVFAICEAAERGRVISRAIIMVQREFAERMMARPGSKTYGRLSVMVQQWAAVEILFHVGSGAFHPVPAVTSSVVRLTPRPAPLAPVRDADLFADVVRAAFGTRRKMLRRSLEPAFGRIVVRAALERARIDGMRRAEELSIEELARLADAVAEIRSSPERPPNPSASDPPDKPHA